MQKDNIKKMKTNIKTLKEKITEKHNFQDSTTIG